MAEDTINVSFEADESGLAQAVEAAKAQFASLDQAAIATGQKIAAGLKGMGISAQAGYKIMGPEDQQNLAAYYASLSKVTGATNEVRDATGRMAEGFRIGSIDIGNLLERIAVRMVILEALRLAIQGV